MLVCKLHCDYRVKVTGKVKDLMTNILSVQDDIYMPVYQEGWGVIHSDFGK